MSFNHLHHSLLTTALGERSAEGREECLAAIAVPTGFPCRQQTAAAKDHVKFQTSAFRVGASFSARFLHWNNSRVKESYCMIGIYCVSEGHNLQRGSNAQNIVSFWIGRVSRHGGCERPRTGICSDHQGSPFY